MLVCLNFNSLIFKYISHQPNCIGCVLNKGLEPSFIYHLNQRSRSSRMRCCRTLSVRWRSQSCGWWRARGRFWPRFWCRSRRRISGWRTCWRRRRGSGRATAGWRWICGARCSLSRMTSFGRSSTLCPMLCFASWVLSNPRRTPISCTSCCPTRSESNRLLKWILKQHILFI